MDNVLNNLQSLISEEETSKELSVEEKIANLGPEPSLIQVATVLLSQSSNAELEAKKVTKQLARNLVETVQTVKTHHADIEVLKTDMDKAKESHYEIKSNPDELMNKFNQMHSMVSKTYLMICQNQQRSSKGNFTLSGEQMPKFRAGEDLISTVINLVYTKYEFYIDQQEFKVVHRLPGNRILFALNNRLPGWSHEQLIRAMNSNPNSDIKVFVKIQLFEPYSELHYIARRLKHHQIITYYRLDDNGLTYIALNEQTRAFKFTGLQQLTQLQLEIPPEILAELSERRRRIAESDDKNTEENMKKAYEPRPNPPPKSDSSRGATSKQPNSNQSNFHSRPAHLQSAKPRSPNSAPPSSQPNQTRTTSAQPNNPSPAKVSPIPTLPSPSVPLPPIKSATFPSRNPPPTRFRFQSSTGWGAAGSSSTSTSPFIFGASAAPRQSVKDLNKIFSEQLGYMDHISHVMARTPTN